MLERKPNKLGFQTNIRSEEVGHRQAAPGSRAPFRPALNSRGGMARSRPAGGFLRLIACLTAKNVSFGATGETLESIGDTQGKLIPTL